MLIIPSAKDQKKGNIFNHKVNEYFWRKKDTKNKKVLKN
jgi:hypothetical protein